MLHWVATGCRLTLSSMTDSSRPACRLFSGHAIDLWPPIASERVFRPIFHVLAFRATASGERVLPSPQPLRPFAMRRNSSWRWNRCNSVLHLFHPFQMFHWAAMGCRLILSSMTENPCPVRRLFSGHAIGFPLEIAPERVFWLILHTLAFRTSAFKDRVSTPQQALRPCLGRMPARAV